MGKLNGCRIQFYDDGSGDRVSIDVQILGETNGPACKNAAFCLAALSKMNKELFGVEIPYPDQVKDMIKLHVEGENGK